MEFHDHRVSSLPISNHRLEQDILCVTMTSYNTGLLLLKEQMEKHAFINYYILPSTIYYILFLSKRSTSSQFSGTQQWHKVSISKSLCVFSQLVYNTRHYTFEFSFFITNLFKYIVEPILIFKLEF